MKKRILAAVVLVLLLLAIIWAAPKILAAIVVGLICALAAGELLYKTGLVRHSRLVVYSMLIAFCVPLWCHFGMPSVWAQVGVTLYFVLLFAEMMLSHIKVRFDRVCICMFAGLLVPYLLSSLIRIFIMEHGRYLILLPFIAAILSDTGAYFVGRKYGSRKLAPVISPNKSVEGAIGGVVAAVLGMLLYTLIIDLAFPFEANYLAAILYGLIGAVCGVFGDLCLSVIKRQTGIKDYGNLIPGHGGVLDRFDSILMVGPVIEILLMIFPVVVKS